MSDEQAVQWPDDPMARWPDFLARPILCPSPQPPPLLQLRTTMADSNLTHRTIDPFSREVLEFPAVLELLHGYLSGPISEPLLEQVEPHTNWKRFGAIWNWRARRASTCARALAPAWRGLCEPSPLLEKLRVEGLALAALEILALVEVARAGWTCTARLRAGGPRASVTDAFAQGPRCPRHLRAVGTPARNWRARCRISAAW